MPRYFAVVVVLLIASLPASIFGAAENQNYFGFNLKALSEFGFRSEHAAENALFSSAVAPPVIATNGKVTFSSSRDGNYEIYLMDQNGVNPQRLTNNAADDLHSVFSPDGSKIAFASGRDGNSEIYLMNADGANLVRLTNNFDTENQPSFSPDGSKIVYTRFKMTNYEIYQMNADGSNQVNLSQNSADDFDPSFSPDGSKIVFTSYRAGNSEIYLMNADGTNPVRLTNDETPDLYPSFSPDGSKIVFTSSRDGDYEIYAMNADGTNVVRLTNSAEIDYQPQFSPDASKIVFTSYRDGNYEIYSINADGTNPQRLTNNSAGDFFPKWQKVMALPGELQFSSATYNAGEQSATATLTVTRTGGSDGSVAVQYAASNGSATAGLDYISTVGTLNFAAGETSKTLTISIINETPRIFEGDETVNLTLSNPTGGAALGVQNSAVLTIIDDETEPVISIDDVSVNEPLTGAANAVFAINLNYASTQAITVSAATANGTATSPADFDEIQNAQITFVPGETSKQFEVQINSDLQSETLEAFFVNLTLPSNGVLGKNQGIGKILSQFGGNGRIVFATDRDGNSEIYSMSSDGSNLLNLTNNSGEDYAPRVSADGTKIIFVSERDGNAEIYVMNTDGSSQTRLTNDPGADNFPALSSNNSQIAFVSDRDGNPEIYLADFDGANLRRLTESSSSERSPVFSPDNLKIIFNTDRDGNEEIYSMNLDGSNFLNLTQDESTDSEPAFSADGSKIVFVSDANGDQNIYAMNADGSNRTRIIQNAAMDSSPAFSPNDAKIIFASDRDGNSEIYAANFDGSDISRLTNAAGVDKSPSWQPITETSYLISGRVFADDGSTPLSNITVNISGGANGSIATDSNGNFSFANLTPTLNYTISPQGNAVFAFTPQTFNNLQTNQTPQFTATRNVYSLSGTIISAGNPLGGVSVSLTGGNATATTDQNGIYLFENVPAGRNYTITPSLANYSFTPPSAEFTNLTANQSGVDFSATLNCVYQLSTTMISVSSGGTQSSSVNVTAPNGCGWTATANDNWLAIAQGSEQGEGNGTVVFSVSANNAAARTGTLTIAGQTVTIEQENGCQFAINPINVSATSAGGSGNISVMTAAGCDWTASTADDWISITSGATGSGNGTVSYTIAENTAQSARSGSILIGSQTFAVSQAAAPPPCLSVTLPGSQNAMPGTIVTVPLTVSDLTGQNVTGFDFRLSFDPNVVRPLGGLAAISKTGTLSEDLTFSVNTNQSGLLLVAGAADSPISGMGPLLNLKFEIIGADGTASDLNWQTFRFNTGIPCGALQNGHLSAVNGTISGNVAYGITPQGQSVRGVSNVTLSANGTSQLQTVTNNLGDYSLSDFVAGNYTLTPSKSGDVGQPLSTLDATLVLQSIVELVTLTPAQMAGADTDLTGDLSTVDATNILRAIVGLPNPGAVGQWKFLPAERSYLPLTSDQNNQNFQAVVVGDVDGDWSPDGNQTPLTAEKPLSENNSLFVASPQAVSVSLPGNARAQNGTTVVVPISVGDTTGQNITGYNFVLTFDSAVLQPLSGSQAISRSGTLSQDMTCSVNTTVAGQLSVACAADSPIDAPAGTLLNLRFNVVGAANSSTALTWQTFRFNAGTPQATPVNGNFSVQTPTAALVSIGGRVLTNQGRGIRNALVSLIAADGTTRAALSGINGNYSFPGVSVGETYTIEVSAKRFTFSQPAQMRTVHEEIADVNFIADN